MNQEQPGPSLATRIQSVGGVLFLFAPFIIFIFLAITVVQIAKK
jgi:hypothetical protein